MKILSGFSQKMFVALRFFRRSSFLLIPTGYESGKLISIFNVLGLDCKRFQTLGYFVRFERF